MIRDDQVKLVQDHVNLLGKVHIILLNTLDGFFGAPLSTNEKIVLLVLDEEPISIKEISLRTGLALSTLTNVIDKMEGKRLVRRRPSRTDRRMMKIEMEVAGRRIKSRFNRLIKELVSAFLVSLSEEDRTNFTSILEKNSKILFAGKDQIPEILGSVEGPLHLTLSKQSKGQ